MVCDWCGKPITKRDRHGNRNKHHYCCQECGYKAKVKKQNVICDWCGSAFMKKQSDIARSKHNFCSEKCSAAYTRWSGTSGRAALLDGTAIHRVIAEEVLGRKLKPDEEVHHIDFNHHNNRIENLQILSKSEHSKIHAARKERNEYGRFIAKVTDA